MLCNFVRRACARNYQFTLRLLAATLVVAGLTASSPAALIGTYSLRFDGFVKSGANTGEEGHFAANLDYLDNTPPKSLPANVDPPAPLANAFDLRIVETETANTMTFFITNPTGGDIFANPLDPAIPVEWEGIFTFEGLAPLEKITITSVGFEHGNTSPFPPPTSQTITGKGTAGDPLTVSLLISPSQFNPTPSNRIPGPVKIHLEYDRELIPEPASIALGLFGIVGLAGLFGRRR